MSSIKKIDKEIQKQLKEISKNLPKFKDGRINYKSSHKAIVLTCFVKYKDKILLLKRSNKVAAYKGKWNTVAGYIDDNQPLKEKVLEELREEVRIKEKDISEFKFGNKYEFTDKQIKKTWIVYPILTTLKNKPNIKLDWEHDEFRWILPKEIKKFDIVPEIDKELETIL